MGKVYVHSILIRVWFVIQKRYCLINQLSDNHRWWKKTMAWFLFSFLIRYIVTNSRTKKETVAFLTLQTIHMLLLLCLLQRCFLFIFLRVPPGHHKMILNEIKIRAIVCSIFLLEDIITYILHLVRYFCQFLCKFCGVYHPAYCMCLIKLLKL